MSRPTIERVEGTVMSVVGPMMGDEWPRRRRFPDQVVDSGTTITLGGVELDERTVFAGDVVYNGMPAYLADGRLDEWIATLTRLRLELR